MIEKGRKMRRAFLPIYRELTAVTPELEAFSREQLGGGRGEAVPYRAFPGLLRLECFWNVGEMVRRVGGEMVCGWHVRDFGGALLEAEAHAVWRQPGGRKGGQRGRRFSLCRTRGCGGRKGGARASRADFTR